MSSPTLLILYLLAIFIPILAVQLPRYTSLKNRHLALLVAPRNPEEPAKPASYDGAEGASSNDGLFTQSAMQAARKPWDPPFPSRAPDRKRTGSWLILPRNGSPRRGETGDAQHEAARRVDVCEGKGDIEEEPPVVPEKGPKGISQQHQHPTTRSGGMRIVWPVIAVLTAILLVLAFAVLIAHCLAWFLVYKTEARLGEVRRGLLKGGEMRLCLCAA